MISMYRVDKLIIVLVVSANCFCDIDSLIVVDFIFLIKCQNHMSNANALIVIKELGKGLHLIGNSSGVI